MLVYPRKEFLRIIEYLNSRLEHKTIRMKKVYSRNRNGSGRYVKEEQLSGIYYSHNPYKNEYIYSLETMEYLRTIIITLGLKPDRVLDISYDKDYKIAPFDKEMAFKMDAREYQEQYINRIKKQDLPTYLVHLQMGMGKTAIATKLMETLNYLTAVIGAPAFVKKWHDDLTKGYFSSNADEVYLVQQTSSIIKLFKELEKGRKIKFLLISTATFKKFIERYTTTPPTLYDLPVTPIEFGRKLGIGLVINDEVHQNYNANFLTSIFIDAKITTGLTATLVTRDKKLAMMHALLYPKESIFEFLEYKKLINSIGVRYRVSHMYNINKTMNGANYSQAVLEQRILQNPQLRNYIFKMLEHYFIKGYMEKKKDGEKAIFYFNTVKFCSKFTYWLNQRQKKVKVRRYTQKDPYAHLMESDVVVTTYKSAGTGEDIKNLITVFNFDVFKSIVMNLQLPGRLREKKGSDLYYYYFYSVSNNKHIEYIREREQIIEKMSKSIETIYYNDVLR